MIVCPRCGKENEDANRYCGRCGIEMATAIAPPAPMEETLYCYRHRREPTLLRCGRCERPICTRCARIGPAGPRCPDCARNQTPVTLRGVAHDVRRTVLTPFRGGPYTWYLLVLVLMMAGGILRGCAMRPRPTPPPTIEATAPEPTDQAAPVPNSGR
ncbi:MAG: zinc-ribbon domain-containing protein [Fimbriimonadaceae bacterium]|nr:zinc-ribbon domain-containing protein [Fimbriimonadaceae bacterium]